MQKTFDINDVLNSETRSITYKIHLKDIAKVNSISSKDVSELIFTDFKYSYDDSTYSYWEELTNSVISKISPDVDFYIKIRYTLQDTANEVTISSITVDYEETPDASVLQVPMKQESSIVVNTPRFDIYQKTDVASSLHKKLSRAVNEYIGVECLYFKSSVVETDKFLQEHTMLELADNGTEIKVLFESNEMPSKPMITPFGTTFEIPTEVHIDFEYFKEKLGSYVPESGDVLFIPITKAIWEVNGSELFRGVMNQGVYWKLTLTKYNPKANRNEESIEGGSIIDTLREGGYDVMTAEDAFRDSWSKDEQTVVKPNVTRDLEYQDNAPQINSGIRISKEEIENNFIIVSHFNYDLGSVDDVALQYVIPEINESSFSMWFRVNDVPESSLLVNVQSNQIYSSKFDTSGTVLLKSKETSEIITVTVQDKTIEEFIVNGLYYVIEDNSVNIFNNWYLLNNRYIINNIYGIVQEVPKLSENVWYNIIITDSSQFKQIGIHIYQLAPKSDELDSVFSVVLPNATNEPISNLTIRSGIQAVTNIRLFDYVLSEDEHHVVLNQQLVHNTERAVVNDNVKPAYYRDEYGRPL